MKSRVSSTVTKRKANPRPRKYASASERQAAYRARAPEVCFRAEAKTVETLDRIADTLDQSRADVLLSMTKFALANHDWARFGLTHKPLPFEYGVNPLKKMTKRQEVIEFGKRMGFKASAGKGFVYLTNMVGWGETFDDWDKAHAYLLKAYDDHYVHRTPYPWDYKENPTTSSKIEWKAYTIPGAEDTVYQGAYKGYLGTVRKKGGVWSLLLMKDNKARTPLGIWDSNNGQASGAKAWLEIVVDDESWKHLKRNPTMKAKRKPTPAQLAARERFAEMARSGAFKRKTNPSIPANIKREAEQYADNKRMWDEYIDPDATTPFDSVSRSERVRLALEVMGYKPSRPVRKTNPTKKTVSQKISQLTREGYPQKQAVAIALNEERAGKVKRNPAAEYGYSVDMEGPGKSGLFVTKAVFKTAPDAKQYARALAKMYPSRTIRVMSGGRWLKKP